eukprot:1880858-Prymnesium_polylepis.3
MRKPLDWAWVIGDADIDHRYDFVTNREAPGQRHSMRKFLGSWLHTPATIPEVYGATVTGCGAPRDGLAVAGLSVLIGCASTGEREVSWVLWPGASALWILGGSSNAHCLTSPMRKCPPTTSSLAIS